MSKSPVRRIASMMEGDERLLAVVGVSETRDGNYYLVIRSWPHRDQEGIEIVSIRYAYLTKGGGSDGWVDNGINMRVEGDVPTFLQAVAQAAAASIPRYENGAGAPYVAQLEG